MMYDLYVTNDVKKYKKGWYTFVENLIWIPEQNPRNKGPPKTVPGFFFLFVTNYNL